jgi:hypothetical protein
MKSLLLLLSFGLLVSCSSKNDKKRLAFRIETEEVRSFEEIKSLGDLLLEEHPELKEETRKELKSLLFVTMNKHQELKIEESKIFQLLLEKSLKINQLSDQEIKDKNALKLQLSELYDQKIKNILNLINRIVYRSKKDVTDGGFRDDFMLYMRDFR